MSAIQTLKSWFTGTAFLRFFFSILRSIKPVAAFGKNVFVTRYSLVADVLKREEDFTVHEIDGYKMEAMGNAFVLGMDASPETTRDRNMLMQVIKREDLQFIRDFMRNKAEELINIATPAKRIDVVNEYARVASVRLVDGYFGVPADEKKMMGWQRAIFNEAFVNLSNDPVIHERGMIAAKEVADHISELIRIRKSQSQPLTDNVLNRLILKQPDNPWMDDNGVRRNILCILGVVENTSKVVAHVLDQLLKRPVEFSEARQAAVQNDMKKLKNYCFEALRFNPHNPAILRFCKNGSVVGQGTKYEKRIAPGSTVYAATLSAMFDPIVVKNPRDFNPDRNVEYMHFGLGPHTCTGKYISEVTVPELVGGLLRLPGLRRAPGKEGKILYDQMVFPDRFILQFD